MHGHAWIVGCQCLSLYLRAHSQDECCSLTPRPPAPPQIAFLALLQEPFRAVEGKLQVLEFHDCNVLASSSVHIFQVFLLLAGVLHLTQQSLRMNIVAIVTEQAEQQTKVTQKSNIGFIIFTF